VLEQDIPLESSIESSNPEDSSAVKGEDMELPVNPVTRDELKTVIEELTAEKGEGAFADEDIISKAVAKSMRAEKGVVDPREGVEKYTKALNLLREHPEQWERKGLTFEQEFRMRLKSTGTKLKDPIENPYTDH
jgi:hypothetical protein